MVMALQTISIAVDQSVFVVVSAIQFIACEFYWIRRECERDIQNETVYWFMLEMGKGISLFDE